MATIQLRKQRYAKQRELFAWGKEKAPRIGDLYKLLAMITGNKASGFGGIFSGQANLREDAAAKLTDATGIDCRVLTNPKKWRLYSDVVSLRPLPFHITERKDRQVYLLFLPPSSRVTESRVVRHEGDSYRIELEVNG